MTEILEAIRIIIETIIRALGYPGIAFVMFAENIFPPIPSELVMPFAGFLVADGVFTLPGILIAGTVGAVVGAVVLYYIGVWSDERVIRTFVRNYGKWFLVSENELDRAMDFFDKYGEIVIFFGRLIPLVRSLISIPAGMNRMNMVRFLGFTTLGTLIWNAFLGVSGYFLGENWQDILEIVDQYETVMLVLMALAVAAYVVWKVKSLIDERNARKTTEGE